MNEQPDFFYSDSRLEMSLFGRFLVRLIPTVFYAVLIAATFIFLLSDVDKLRLAGAIFFLFLLHKIFRFGQSDVLISSVTHKNFGNVSRFFTPMAYRSLARALDRANLRGGDVQLHLLNLLIDLQLTKDVLTRLECDFSGFSSSLREKLKVPAARVDAKAMLLKLNLLAEQSFRCALNDGSRAVAPLHLLAALGSAKNDSLAPLFREFDIAESDIYRAILLRRAVDSSPRNTIIRTLPKHHFMNRAWTARATPNLDRFSQDFTDLARMMPTSPLIGQATAYENILGVLARPGRENVLLIAPPGLRVSDLVMHLAYSISHNRVPEILMDIRVVALDLGSLSAGADSGDVQKRVKTVINEAVAAGNVILYIPDIHLSLQSGGLGGVAIGEAILSALESTACSVIGSTYPREYQRNLEQIGIFRGAFQTVRVNEITPEEAMEFLTRRAAAMEVGSRGKLRVSFKAIRAAVFLGHAYFREKPLPANAEDLLSQAFSEALSKGERILSRANVERLAERLSSIPIRLPGAQEATSLLKFEERVHEKFIDQTEAVAAVGKALREYRAGLARKGGPMASFLFVGPTGVGKTELAKLLAEFQFGSREAMLRFDMTEYQNADSIKVLIGSSDGTGLGTLTEAVRLKPYSLVLLDEFEKAHPDILNLFLQVFDDARLTDAKGETVDFQNTIIIATSNAHSDFVRSELEAGRAVESFAKELVGKLADVFRPELLNRFSQIVVFKALSTDDIRAVAELKLAALAKSVLDEQGIVLAYDKEVSHTLAKLGFDPAFGARPLDRAIADYIKDPLSRKILGGEIARGGIISIIVSDGKILL